MLTKQSIAGIKLEADTEHNKLTVGIQDVERVYCHDDGADGFKELQQRDNSDLLNINSRELSTRDRDIDDRVR